MVVLLVISCKNQSSDLMTIPPIEISIPADLKGNIEIESFIEKTEVQINCLATLSQELILQYRKILDDKTMINGLMTDVKKVTTRARINAAFVNLSEIYNEIDFQSSVMENQLNSEQKKAFRMITIQLKNKIDEIMISYKSFEKEFESGKIIIY